MSWRREDRQPLMTRQSWLVDSVYLFLILLNFSAILISARGGGSLFMEDDKINGTRVK